VFDSVAGTIRRDERHHVAGYPPNLEAHFRDGTRPSARPAHCSTSPVVQATFRSAGSRPVVALLPL
jgi:hypothetical protein